MLNLLIRDLNLTLKPYGLQVVELPNEERQNPHSNAVRTAEPPVLEHVPEPQPATKSSKRERLLRLMGNRSA